MALSGSSQGKPEFVPAPNGESLQIGALDEAHTLLRDIESDLKRELPEQQQSKAIRVVRQVMERHASFSGPQPPPELLAQYEKVCPGWAVRLLEMGEREQLHRMSCEKTVLELNRESLGQERSWIDYSMRGQVLGFIAFVVLAAIGVYALYLHLVTVALVCFGSFALGIVGTFIKGHGVLSQSGLASAGDKASSIQDTTQAARGTSRGKKKR